MTDIKSVTIAWANLKEQSELLDKALTQPSPDDFQLAAKEAEKIVPVLCGAYSNFMSAVESLKASHAVEKMKLGADKRHL